MIVIRWPWDLSACLLDLSEKCISLILEELSFVNVDIWPLDDFRVLPAVWDRLGVILHDAHKGLRLLRVLLDKLDDVSHSHAFVLWELSCSISFDAESIVLLSVHLSGFFHRHPVINISSLLTRHGYAINSLEMSCRPGSQRTIV